MGYSIEMIYQSWTRTVFHVKACVILIARFQLMGLSTLYFGNVHVHVTGHFKLSTHFSTFAV